MISIYYILFSHQSTIMSSHDLEMITQLSTHDGQY